MPIRHSTYTTFQRVTLLSVTLVLAVTALGTCAIAKPGALLPAPASRHDALSERRYPVS